MARYIALLRAVNVGGTGKLRMADLCRTLESAGFENVQTLLASGNVVLDATKSATAKLESTLEKLLADQHGLTTDIMVRTPDEWTAMIKANPMPDAAHSTPSAFGLMILKGKPDTKALTRFMESWQGPERMAAGKGCLYIQYPDGMGQSKLTFPKAIGIGTVRNWNTVLKLANMNAVE